MTGIEAWSIALWAGGVMASFLYWLHLTRDVPLNERNNPVMLCVMWPAVGVFLIGFVVWFVVDEMRHAFNKMARE